MFEAGSAMGKMFHPRELQILHEGGTVKKTGLALVEKGEKVIPVEKNSRAKSSMGGGEKKSGGKKSSGKGHSKSSSKSKHKVHTMHVKHADNGGYIATHDFEPPEGGMGAPAPKSEDHIIPDMQGLQDHMADHMSQEPEPEPQSQPQPSPGGGAPNPMAAMGGGGGM